MVHSKLFTESRSVAISAKLQQKGGEKHRQMSFNR